MSPLRRWFALKGWALLSLALVAGCARTATVPLPSSSTVVKIATHSPLTGGQAPLGESVKLGALLAIEEYRLAARSPVRVELVSFDDEAKRNVGIANARTIVADRDIVAVIGHLNSGVSIPSSEVYRQGRLAMVSPANTNPLVTERGYDNVFRVIGRDDIQGSVAAEFVSTLGARTVFVVHDRTTYGEGIAEFFKGVAEQRGMNVLGFTGTSERVDFSALVSDIRRTNPDAVFFGGVYDQAAPFIRSLRAVRLRATIIGPDAFDSSDLSRIARDAAVGVYYVTSAGPTAAYPNAHTFVSQFRQRFGKPPDPFAAEAYDATMVTLRAIEKASNAGVPPSREAVTSALRQTSHSGVTGTIEFDDKGDRKKAVYFVVRIERAEPDRWDENRIVKSLISAPPAHR